MSNKNKVVVRIYGQEYTMVSSEPREYMQRVANYVDDKMEDVAKKSKKLSTAMVAVLTSLNIADDYFKTKTQLEGLEKEAMSPLKDLEDVRAQLAVATSLMEDKGQEYREIIEQLQEEMKQVSHNNEDQESLLLEIGHLNGLLREKETEMEKALKANEDLQNKFFDMQIKYVQARKELDAFIDTFDEEKRK